MGRGRGTSISGAGARAGAFLGCFLKPLVERAASFEGDRDVDALRGRSVVDVLRGSIEGASGTTGFGLGEGGREAPATAFPVFFFLVGLAVVLSGSGALAGFLFGGGSCVQGSSSRLFSFEAFFAGWTVGGIDFGGVFDVVN